MQKLDLKNNKNYKTNKFGMPLPPETEIFLTRQLEDLAERCPSASSISLILESQKSSIKGKLKIRSLSVNFTSQKSSTNPISTYLLMQEDIDAQLLDWKRGRFSNRLFNNLNLKKEKLENCA